MLEASATTSNHNQHLISTLRRHPCYELGSTPSTVALHHSQKAERDSFPSIAILFINRPSCLQIRLRVPSLGSFYPHSSTCGNIPCFCVCPPLSHSEKRERERDASPKRTFPGSGNPGKPAPNGLEPTMNCIQA